MENEEFYKRLDKCMEIGDPLMEEFLKIDDPVIFKTIISAIIDVWAVSHGRIPNDVINSIFDAIHELNEEEEEV